MAQSCAFVRMAPTKTKPWRKYASTFQVEAMKDSEKIIRGVVASAGVTTGHAVRAFDPEFISFNYKLKADHVQEETDRFKQSVEKSQRQLRRMQQQLKKRSGPESSFLIDAHL